MAYKDINVGYVYGNWYLRLYLTEKSTNIVNNTSVVSRKLTLRCDNTSTAVSFDVRSAWIGSNKQTIAYTQSGVEHTLIEDTITVDHNTNGKGSYSCGFGISTSYVLNGSGTASITLSTIPRSAKITASSDFNDEGNPTISISNPGNFNMEVWLEPNPPGTHYCIRSVPASSKEYTWELTEEERKQLRTSCKRNNCTMRIGLYSNNKQFGVYVDKKYSIINANPILNEASFVTLNHLDLADNQTIIKGKSNIQVTIEEAIPQKEATIASYKAICGSVIQQGAESTFTLNNVDDSIVRCYSIDSRGNTTEKLISVDKYINYEPVTVDVINFQRTLGGIGSNVDLSISGNMWIGNFGKMANSITAQYYYRERGSNDWIQGTSVIDPIASGKYENTVSIKGDLDANGFSVVKNFDFKVIVSDKLSTNEITDILSKGIPHMSFHDDGVAFGGLYDIDVGGPLQYFSEIYNKMINIDIGPQKVKGTHYFGYQQTVYTGNALTFESDINNVGEDLYTIGEDVITFNKNATVEISAYLWINGLDRYWGTLLLAKNDGVNIATIDNIQPVPVSTNPYCIMNFGPRVVQVTDGTRMKVSISCRDGKATYLDKGAGRKTSYVTIKEV